MQKCHRETNVGVDIRIADLPLGLVENMCRKLMLFPETYPPLILNSAYLLPRRHAHFRETVLPGKLIVLFALCGDEDSGGDGLSD